MRNLNRLTIAAIAAILLTPAFAVESTPCSGVRDSRSADAVRKNVSALSFELRQAMRGLESMAISPHHYQQRSHAVELVRVRDLINRISAEVCAWSSAAGSTSSEVARFAAAARELAVKGNAAIEVINSVPNSTVLLTRPDYSENIAAMNAALKQIAAVSRQQGGEDMVAADD